MRRSCIINFFASRNKAVNANGNNHYQVIARKYRPQTFVSIVGQDAIVMTLKNGLRMNRLAHAYLFCGCRGTGKTTLARVLAKALNCTCLSLDFEPCNSCSSCLDINASRSLDVLEIDGASNRGIDDIRQINETIGYAPASGKYKIYIIDEVHMLTKEAFNALLKTLEEPPVNVKFFFATTEPHKVLPTIISRCQRFDLNRISSEALKEKLAWIAQDLNVSCEEDVFSLIANLSEGSLRDAESLFDQIICYAEQPITAAKVSTTLGLMPRTVFFSLDKAFEEQNLSFAFELSSDIFSSGKDLSYFVDHLIEHYRSLLKFKINRSTTFPTMKLQEQYLSSSSMYTEEQCLYILDFLIHSQQQISKTSFKRVGLEMILLHIIRSKHRMTLPLLVKRLTELEQKLIFASEKLSPTQEQIHPQNSSTISTLMPVLQSISIESALTTTSGKISNNPLNLEAAVQGDKVMQDFELESLPIGKDCVNLSPSTAVSSEKSEVNPIQFEEKNQKIDQNLSSHPLPNQSILHSRYETLMRFAAVELEGMIKKEQPHG